MKLSLVVDMARACVLDLRGESRHHGLLDRLEAVLEIERRERRLEERRKDVPASRDALELVRWDVACMLGKTVAELELLRDRRARGPGDDVSTNLREPPFRCIGKPVVDGLRYCELENTVSEKLEALVGRGPVLGPGRVREDLRQPVGRQLGDQASELARSVLLSPRAR